MSDLPESKTRAEYALMLWIEVALVLGMIAAVGALCVWCVD